INIDALITHTMPLQDINKAFDLLHAGESIRSVVESYIEFDVFVCLLGSSAACK
ncbi:MAG: hypothetical protein ACR2PS_00395, partial [Pseudomonadales bacterium]